MVANNQSPFHLSPQLPQFPRLSQCRSWEQTNSFLDISAIDFVSNEEPHNYTHSAFEAI